MLDPKIGAEMDQSISMMVEFYPPLLWGLYQGFLVQGFDKLQAMYLSGEFLKAMYQAGAEKGREKHE